MCDRQPLFDVFNWIVNSLAYKFTNSRGIYVSSRFTHAIALACCCSIGAGSTGDECDFAFK